MVAHGNDSPPCLVQNAQREVGREGKYPLGVSGVSKKNGQWLRNMALGLSGATDYCVLWCGGVDFGEGGTVGGGGFNSTLDERFGTVDVGTGGMVDESEGFAAATLRSVVPKDAGDAVLIEAAYEVLDVILLEGGGTL